MNVRIIRSFLLAIVGPLILWLVAPLCAGVVVPEFDYPGRVDPSSSPYAAPYSPYAPGYGYAPYMRQDPRPWYSPRYSSHMSPVYVPASPYAGSPYMPPAYVSPYNSGNSAYAAPAYRPLPPVPTSPWYEGGSRFTYVQPWFQNPNLNQCRSAPAAAYGPAAKPFSSYQQAPVVSPYMYLNTDNPNGLLDYYFYVQPPN